MSSNVSTGLLVLGLIGLALPTFSQNEEDALRISTARPSGSARSSGMAGAFGALGADPSAAWLNPAGMALYTTSEFFLTPSFEVNNSSSTFGGNTLDGQAQKVFFSNIGGVLAKEGKEGSNWKGSAFGFVFDRTASHHRETSASRENLDNTFVQQFVDQAQGTPSDLLFDTFPFGAGLAWETFAIDPDTLAGPTSYMLSQGISGTDGRDLRYDLSSSGANSSTAFFYSTNYKDRLYIGGALSVTGSRLERLINLEETSMTDSLRSVTYKERLTSRGSGFDVKFGFLYRFSEKFRGGLAIHSPSFYTVDEAYVTEMSTSFHNGEGYRFTSPDGIFKYRTTTPWRALVSGAYIIAKRGAVSVDYEFTDPRNMRLRRSPGLEDTYDFSIENTRIKNVFRPTHSVRIGTEWRVKRAYFRTGWGIWSNPFAAEDLRSGDPTMRYALGGGYRSVHFSVDLGVNYETSSGGYFTYDPALVDVVIEDRNTIRALVTFAYRP